MGIELVRRCANISVPIGRVQQIMLDNTIVANEMSVSNRNHNFERRNAQTSRAGWRPRQTSKARLAKDIADSIRAHQGREITHYTVDPELVSMVQKVLGW